MEKITKIILWSTGGVVAIAGSYVLIKKLFSSSASNSASKDSSGASCSTSAPLPVDNTPALRNPYAVWTYEIIQTLANAGHTAEAATLTQQFRLAWENAPQGIPLYNNNVALQIKGTDPQGMFAMPSELSTANGQGPMLQTVYCNALVMLTVIGKNNIQKNSSGQGIGKKQTFIRDLYVSAQQNIGDTASIPTKAASLIVVFNYTQNNNFPTMFSGTPDSGAVQNVITASANNNTAILAALA